MNDDPSARSLWILGCGFTGVHAAHVALEAPSYARVVGLTRSPPDNPLALAPPASPRFELRAVPEGFSEASLEALSREHPVERTDVLVCVPPSPADPTLDARIASFLARKSLRTVAYVSTTGVYGNARGPVDEDTPVDRGTPRALERIASEELYRHTAGAVALRAAGIYGPGRGLHRRLVKGDFRLPGDGSNAVSRVHVRDLARICVGVLLTLREGAVRPGAVFAVADDAPVPQREAVAWLCAYLRVPLPPSVPVAEAPATLRHDRRVRNGRVKAALGLALEYPTYREGFAACLSAEGVAR